MLQKMVEKQVEHIFTEITKSNPELSNYGIRPQFECQNMIFGPNSVTLHSCSETELVSRDG